MRKEDMDYPTSNATPAPHTPKKNKKQLSFGRRIMRLLALIVICVAIGAVTMWWFIKRPSLTTTNQPTSRQTLQEDGNKVTTDQESVVANVAENVSPSVVSITTNVRVPSIFGVASQEAAGTGIIVSEDGYILTNKHVISAAEAIHIVTSDGATYEDVSVVGTDPLNDIAFLKIKSARDLTPAVLGDSSTVRVGQTVVAIGNSLGQYQNTVTSGIISGKGRPVAASADGTSATAETLSDLLQTDAAINPGNSGGPLSNRAGQVIGVNTAVAADAQGIGFAIPINATKGMLKSIRDGKGAERAYIGVSYVPVTAAIAKQEKLSVSNGAYVIARDGGNPVQADGPADKAGIRDKDIIVKINGLTVGPQGGVSSLIGEYAPGDTVEMTVLRGGKETTVRVTLAAYPQRTSN